MADTREISRLLRERAGGTQQAQEQLVPLVYDGVRRLAASHLAREQRAVTLQPTALDRRHFFGAAARLMRQILLDHARTRRSLKRGGCDISLDLENAAAIAPRGWDADVIALNDALDALKKIDPRKATIMEMRHFSRPHETGPSLGISVATVQRHARMAEAWLHSEMTAPGGA